MLTLVLAAFSWQYIEVPFRNQNTVLRSKIIYLSIFAMICFGTLGFIGHHTNGFQGRLSSEQLRFERELSNAPTAFVKQALSKNSFDVDSRIKILIVGDSYAKDFLEAIVGSYIENLSKLDIVFFEVSRSCKNVLVDTPNLKHFILEKDKEYCNSAVRLGDPELDPLIKQADLVIVRSFWDILPTLEMSRTFDYVDSVAEGSVIFIGAQVFGHKFPFTGLHSIENIRPIEGSYGVENVMPLSNQKKGYDLA